MLQIFEAETARLRQHEQPPTLILSALNTMLSAASPIKAEDFAAWMETIPHAANQKHLGIAVSGGADSMALAILTQEWATARQIAITAYIVDHRLRPESTAEATQTEQHLTNRGIRTKILTWHHSDITTRIHVHARLARYNLLAAACAHDNIDTLLLAHHRDDQAETILMRFAKGSGIDGLAGMSVHVRHNDIHILRPLLHATKAQLIATCESTRTPYVNDPSNEADKYARGRLRRVMPLLAEEGFTVDRLNDLAHRAALARDALEFYACDFLKRAAQQDPFGIISLDHAEALMLPRAVLERVVTRAMRTLHPEAFAPEYRSLTQLIDALHKPSMPPRTLQGVVFSRRGKNIILMRELAAIQDRPAINGQAKILWDQRWEISAQLPSAETYEIRPLGLSDHAILDKLAPHLRKSLPQGRARATLPGLWQGGTLKLIPCFYKETHQDSATSTMLQAKLTRSLTDS